MQTHSLDFLSYQAADGDLQRQRWIEENMPIQDVVKALGIRHHLFELARKE